jgi:hypothetical protein
MPWWSLGVVVLEGPANESPEVSLSERYEAARISATNGAEQALSKGVQVGTSTSKSGRLFEDLTSATLARRTAI